MALDCSSWGALFLLKQAKLANEQGRHHLRSGYLTKALQCLNYAETHFKTKWFYKNSSGRKGAIEGYRPYDGVIDDLLWIDGIKEGERIDWDSMDDMVWSEGTLGVAKAWEEYARESGNINAEKRSKEIYHHMKNLQSLSDQGGLLYSTKQIKGHFTMGEELASISWLAYMALLHGELDWKQYEDILQWTPW
jgi:hypothetical protein